MNLLSVFIHRPVASVLLAIAIVLLGILAYFRLPVAALPQADIPTIVVRASLPGASPESMSATVATPLERAMMGVSGVKGINSSSNQSAAQVVLHFDLDTDINEAAREVQAAINAAFSFSSYCTFIFDKNKTLIKETRAIPIIQIPAPKGF